MIAEIDVCLTEASKDVFTSYAVQYGEFMYWTV